MFPVHADMSEFIHTRAALFALRSKREKLRDSGTGTRVRITKESKTPSRVLRLFSAVYVRLEIEKIKRLPQRAVKIARASWEGKTANCARVASERHESQPMSKGAVLRENQKRQTKSREYLFEFLKGSEKIPFILRAH